MTFGMLREYIDIVNTPMLIVIDNKIVCSYHSEERAMYWKPEDMVKLCSRFSKYDNLLVSKIDADLDSAEEPTLRVYLFDFEKIARETENFNRE